MIRKREKQTLYIEGSAIAELNPSGIGHSIASTIMALSQNKEFNSKYEIKILVARSKKDNINRWGFPGDVVSVKSIIIQRHILHILLKYGLLMPMDMITGRGVYIFPNYKNWPLLFSKSITYIYDVAYMIYPETVQPKNLNMLQRNIPKWIKRTNKIITISESSKNEIIEYLKVPQNKIGIVSCGVNKDIYYPRANEQVEKTKNKFNLKGNYILFVGNIEPRKNISNLLLAYSGLPNNIKNKYSLLLVGSGGWLNSDILKQLKKLQSQGNNIIHPSEYVSDEDIPALYTGASILVHPAIHEGFGIPPLQALACGTPIAISDISALREVFQNSGNYFDPQNVDSIKQTIMRSLESDNKSFKKTALSVVNKYSWDNSATQLVSQIEGIR